MVKVTEYKLRKTAKNKGITGFQNKSEKELLQNIYKLKRIYDNLSRNGFNKIIRMQSFSLNELKKIERMNNLSLNALKQTAITRNIKNYEDMSKKDLLIALIKSNESHIELLKDKDSNTEIRETRNFFNKHRSNFSQEELKKHRKNLNRKEPVFNFLKEKEQKSSLTNIEKKVLKNIDQYFKNFKNDLKEKLQKFQYNITYGLDYLFNKLDEVDYYEPKEVKSVFNGSYVLYESKGGHDDNLSLEEYLNTIRPYLRDMIDDHKAHSEWKIQLIMQIIFVSSLDNNQTHIMHTKSNNIEIIKGIETNDAINELFNSFFTRYQEGLETKMKGSGYIFDNVDLLEYHLHKISLNRGGSYINSPEWLKNKGATISPKNTRDNECFKYAIIASLYHQEIGRNLQRISKLKSFINSYNWKDIEFPSHSKDWKKFEQNNKTIALNILYVTYNTEQIRPAYISKCNHKRDKQVNVLMITDNMNDWHYLAVKNVSILLRGITSNHNGDFYCLNCLYSYRTKDKL